MGRPETIQPPEFHYHELGSHVDIVRRARAVLDALTQT